MRNRNVVDGIVMVLVWGKMADVPLFNSVGWLDIALLCLIDFTVTVVSFWAKWNKLDEKALLWFAKMSAKIKVKNQMKRYGKWN